MTSKYELDRQEISRIQFSTEWDQATKNKLIEFIKKRMGEEEQLELDGEGTGYYQTKPTIIKFNKKTDEMTYELDEDSKEELK